MPMVSSQDAVASWVERRRWLVTWIQWPASCQARTVSTASGYGTAAAMFSSECDSSTQCTIASRSSTVIPQSRCSS
jgi:hypothetical protein